MQCKAFDHMALIMCSLLLLLEAGLLHGKRPCGAERTPNCRRRKDFAGLAMPGAATRRHMHCRYE